MRQNLQRNFSICGYRLGWIAICACCFIGCRALRANRQNRELTAARQMSLRGAEALQQKKYADAESLFSEAIRQSPVDERAQSGYAEVLLQKGQVQAAAEHMKKAVETSGGNPDLVVRLGKMHFEQGQLASALEQADLALRNQRTHAGAWALKGDVLRQQRQLREALDCYHRSLIYQSDAPEVQIALAEIYCQIDRPQRALATLNNLADNHSPEQIPPRAWMLKGQALASLGEDAEAKRCLRLASQYAAESQSGLLLELASAQYCCGDLAEARLCLGRVLQHDPSNPSALRLQSQLDQSFVQMASDANGDAPTFNATYQRGSQQATTNRQ